MSAFVEADRRLLGQVLNRILPAGAGLPAGGALGVVTYVEEAIGRDPTQRRLFLEGLGAIAATCHARHGNAFEDAGERDQDDVLREVHSARPDFFDALLVHAYSGYYSNPEIVRLLGLEVWPPQPRGHHLAPFDPSLLQIVKDRPPLYRPTP